MSAQELITEHLDLWTGAVTKKSSSGRGSNGKIELTGIKKLRELILELAVRGKLVGQDDADEPAKDLLSRIAEEKSELISAGKLKKQTALPPINDSDTPFSLPSSWTWTRLGNYGADIHYGFTASANEHLSEYRLLRITDIQNDKVNWTTVPGCEISKQQAEPYLLSDNDILIARTGGTIGKSFLVQDINVNAVFASYLIRLKKLEATYARYVKVFLGSHTYWSQLYDASMGTGQPNVNGKSLKNLLFPVPPIEEQHRIVQKVDELMGLCDRLEQQTSDQLEAHETLVDTLLGTLTQSENATELADNWARLAAHFDTLLTTEQSIDRLKQTILQLAVMGRLVEQDAGDEPAHSLLDRLTENRQAWLQEQSSRNPECKTMLRKLGKLCPAQSPFPLPRGWQPAHLIQLCRMLVDCHNKTAPYVEEGIPIIRTSNIRERRFNFNEMKYVDEDTYTYWSRRCPPEPGDIIFTREAPMGEAAIIPEGKTWCLGQRTMLIRPMHEHINNSFLLLALTEPHLLERAAEKAIGSTVKHLRVGDVENLVVPVPPLNEQHRIVQKVDELMALCNQLKERLNQAGETRCHLAEAVVEKALT